jgi:hypothetical protein
MGLAHSANATSARQEPRPTGTQRGKWEISNIASNPPRPRSCSSSSKRFIKTEDEDEKEDEATPSRQERKGEMKVV